VLAGICARAGAEFLFTVCDSAAGEVCPAWPGQPLTAHWGIADPAAVEGSEIGKETAFVTAFRHRRNRLVVFSALPLAGVEIMPLSGVCWRP
jgi:hypothetical protein